MQFWKRWFRDRRSTGAEATQPRAAQPSADEGTLALLNTVAAADPDNGDALLGLGMLQLREFGREPAQASLNAATSYLARAVELLPDSPEAHFYLALAQSFALDSLDAADQHLARALELDPTLDARADEIRERLAAARSGLQQQAVDPDTLRAAVAHYDAGMQALDDDRVEAAVAEFSAAIELYPAYVEAIVSLAEAYRQLDRLDDAIGTLRRALALRPRLFDAHVALGSLYVQRDNRPRALEQLSLALEIKPDHPQIRRSVGLLQLSTGDAVAAQSTFRRLAALRPDDVEARLHLALAAAQAGDFSVARESLAALTDQPLNAKHHRLAAQIFEQLGDPVAASAHREQAG